MQWCVFVHILPCLCKNCHFFQPVPFPFEWSLGDIVFCLVCCMFFLYLFIHLIYYCRNLYFLDASCVFALAWQIAFIYYLCFSIFKNRQLIYHAPLFITLSVLSSHQYYGDILNKLFGGECMMKKLHITNNTKNRGVTKIIHLQPTCFAKYISEIVF